MSPEPCQGHPKPPTSPSHQTPLLATAVQPGRGQMCPEIFVAPLAGGSGGPIPSLGHQDGEQAVSIAGTGRKSRMKELLGRRNRGKEKEFDEMRKGQRRWVR